MSPVQQVHNSDLTGYRWRNADLYTDTARANLLVNGGFENWQRGVGAFLTNGAWTADRWQLSISLSSCQVVQESTYQVSGLYAAKMVYTHVAGGYAFLEQKLEPNLTKSLRGKTIAVSVRTFTSVAGGHSVQIVTDGTGALNTSAVGSSSTPQTLRVTGTVPTDANNLYVRLISGSVTDNIWWDEAMLVVGSVASDFIPLHPTDDLARCQRYYEIVGGGTTLIFSGCATAASQTFYYSTPYKVVKPVMPTVTKLGLWTGVSSNATTANNDAIDFSMCRWTVVANAAGPFYVNPQTIGFSVEANP